MAFFFLMQHLFQNDIISTHGFHFAFVMLFFQTLKFCAQICLYSSKTQLPITGNMLITRYQNNKINISETIVAFSSYTYTLFLYNNTKATIEFNIQSGTFLRIKNYSVNNDEASRPRGGLSWESDLCDHPLSAAFC